MRGILARLRLVAEAGADSLPELLLQAHAVANMPIPGEHRTQRSGQGDQFWQFRPYSSQDRPQDIDWRQSGKGDQIFIRQKQKQNVQSVLFWCNPHASMDYTSSSRRPTKREAAHILTLALAIMMQRAGEHIGVAGQHKTGRSESMLNDLGEALISKDALSLYALPGVVARAQSALVLCSDFIEDAALGRVTLNALAPRFSTGVVIQVLDPAEMDLPWRGRVIFEDGISSLRESIHNVSSVREAYRQKIQNHIAQYKKICDAIGWMHVVHRTDQPYAATLEKIYALNAARTPDTASGSS